MVLSNRHLNPSLPVQAQHSIKCTTLSRTWNVFIRRGNITAPQQDSKTFPITFHKHYWGMNLEDRIPVQVLQNSLGYVRCNEAFLMAKDFKATKHPHCTKYGAVPPIQLLEQNDRTALLLNSWLLNCCIQNSLNTKITVKMQLFTVTSVDFLGQVSQKNKYP